MLAQSFLICHQLEGSFSRKISKRKDVNFRLKINVFFIAAISNYQWNVHHLGLSLVNCVTDVHYHSIDQN